MLQPGPEIGSQDEMWEVQTQIDLGESSQHGYFKSIPLSPRSSMLFRQQFEKR
jgi:hypothetical protein